MKKARKKRKKEGGEEGDKWKVEGGGNGGVGKRGRGEGVWEAPK